MTSGESIRVTQDYAEVCEKLRVARWRDFCEFHERHTAGEGDVTINPATISYLRAV
jgi:hypothetical protein